MYVVLNHRVFNLSSILRVTANSQTQTQPLDILVLWSGWQQEDFSQSDSFTFHWFNTMQHRATEMSYVWITCEQWEAIEHRCTSLLGKVYEHKYNERAHTSTSSLFEVVSNSFRSACTYFVRICNHWKWRMKQQLVFNEADTEFCCRLEILPCN